jgi:hypothetical protein
MLEYLDTAIGFAVIMLSVSLLITILNQMISALLSARGTNLRWGIRTLLDTIDPKLSGKSSAIATQILQQPLVSDSIFSRFSKNSLMSRISNRWKLASAITPQELIRSIRILAETMPPKADEKPTTDEEKQAVTAQKETADLIRDLLAKVDPEAARKAKMLSGVFAQLGPGIAIQADKIVQALGTSLQESIGEFEVWFDTVMKRASQRFTSQMRIWTVVFAVLIAFGARLNTFEILDQLWTTPELRSSLVSDRETILKEAAMVLAAQSDAAKVAGPGIPPQILAKAMKALKDVDKEAAESLGDAPEFANLDRATDWLRENIKGDESLKEKAISAYRNLVLAELSAQAEKIRQDLAKAGLQINLVASWSEFTGLFKARVFLGILIFVGLLSLGAPFWFNTLRSLSNLRPLLAKTSSSMAEETTRS